MPDETSPSQDTPSTVPAPSDSKPCPICGEEIKPLAKKCIHCSSDLTWRSYLGLSSTTLALLTALVSVITTGVPPLYQALQAKDSRMHFSLVLISPQEVGTPGSYPFVTVVVSNIGTRPGMFYGGRIHVSGVRSSVISEFNFNLELSETSDSTKSQTQSVKKNNNVSKTKYDLIQPGTSRLFDINIRSDWVWKDLKDAKMSEAKRLFTAPKDNNAPISFSSAHCTVELSFFNFSGRDSSEVHPLECYYLAWALRNDGFLSQN